MVGKTRKPGKLPLTGSCCSLSPYVSFMISSLDSDKLGWVASKLCAQKKNMWHVKIKQSLKQSLKNLLK